MRTGRRLDRDDRMAPMLGSVFLERGGVLWSPHVLDQPAIGRRVVYIIACTAWCALLAFVCASDAIWASSAGAGASFSAVHGSARMPVRWIALMIVSAGTEGVPVTVMRPRSTSKDSLSSPPTRPDFPPEHWALFAAVHAADSDVRGRSTILAPGHRRVHFRPAGGAEGAVLVAGAATAGRTSRRLITPLSTVAPVRLIV